jgi:hypothetical protein
MNKAIGARARYFLPSWSQSHIKMKWLCNTAAKTLGAQLSSSTILAEPTCIKCRTKPVKSLLCKAKINIVDKKILQKVS